MQPAIFVRDNFILLLVVIKAGILGETEGNEQRETDGARDVFIDMSREKRNEHKRPREKERDAAHDDCIFSIVLAGEVEDIFFAFQVHANDIEFIFVGGAFEDDGRIFE